MAGSPEGELDIDGVIGPDEEVDGGGGKPATGLEAAGAGDGLDSVDLVLEGGFAVEEEEVDDLPVGGMEADEGDLEPAPLQLLATDGCEGGQGLGGWGAGTRWSRDPR